MLAKRRCSILGALIETTIAKLATRRSPPGPRGNLLLGSALDFRRDITQTFIDAWRQYGDVLRFRVANRAMYLLVHPDYVQHVLQDRKDNFPHSAFVDDRLKTAFGEGLLTSEGDLWHRQRRLVEEAFQRERIVGLAPLTAQTIAEALDEWKHRSERGQGLDMREEMSHLTLKVLARAIFSTDLGEEANVIAGAVTVGVEYLSRRLTAPFLLPESIPLPLTRRYLKGRAALDAIVYRLIEERRREQDGRDDLLAKLLKARDELGESMSDRQLRDEVVTLVLAGHETVSTGLSWMCYILSRHPDIAQRVHAEVDEVLGDRTPTAEDIPQLQYTTMVIKEALRLYPPVWIVARTPLEDDEVGGYHIPAGTIVYLSPYVTHRHPDFWENPEGVDPERFTKERSQGRHRFAWFPFSGGPRGCVGFLFANQEMQLVLAMMAQRFRLNIVPGHPIALRPEISLRPRYGMLMTLTPRRAGSTA